MEKTDLAIVLGARCGRKNGSMRLGESAEMRARAVGIAYRKGLVEKIVLSGGYNFKIRYDLDLEVPVYNSTQRPDLLDKETYQKACQEARIYRSEASLMGEFLQKNYGVAPEKLIFEENSETTQQNVEYCREIIRRLCQEKRNGCYCLSIFTNLYHMSRVLNLFQKEVRTIKEQCGCQIKIIPFYAEDFLVMEDPFWIDLICEYYRYNRHDRDWDINHLREVLISGRSVAELLKADNI